MIVFLLWICFLFYINEMYLISLCLIRAGCRELNPPSPVSSSVARLNPAAGTNTLDPKPALGHPNDHGLVLRGKKNEDRYWKLRRKMMMATVYYNSSSLTTLGLSDDVDDLLDPLQMKRFAHNSWPTYDKLVIEFLSSLALVKKGKQQKDDDIIGFHICLNEVEYYKNIAWLNGIYGFRSSGLQFVILEYEREIGSFYFSLPRHNLPDFKNAEASTVLNPVFFILHQFFACTIFALYESTDNMWKDELFFLWAMTRCKTVELNIAVYLLHHWYFYAPKSSGKICFGGLITPIAMALRYDFTG